MDSIYFLLFSEEILRDLIPEAVAWSCSIKKSVLGNFVRFTVKHWSSESCWWPATLLKKRLQHRYFPVNFAKFIKTPFLQNTSERLPLEFYS